MFWSMIGPGLCVFKRMIDSVIGYIPDLNSLFLVVFRTDFHVVLGVIFCVQTVGLHFSFYGFSYYSFYHMSDVGYDFVIIEIDRMIPCSYILSQH